MEQWIYVGIIAHLEVELTRGLEKSTIKGKISEPEESEAEELDLQKWDDWFCDNEDSSHSDSVLSDSESHPVLITEM